MLELTPGFFALAVPAAIFAGISKGGFGSGAAFASSTILAVMVEPTLALGIMLPLLMLIDLATLKPYWKTWSTPDARLLILGGVPGVALGVGLFAVANADVLRVLIGVISVGFVVWHMAQARGLIRAHANRLPPVAGIVAGVVAGFTSFVSHAGGPPAAVYLLSQRLTKTQYQGTTVLVFWVVNIAKFVPYAFLGMFTLQTLVANLFLAPFAVLGAWIGVRLHWAMPERVFFGITYVLLTVTGAKLIWDGVT